jgi:dihydroflavonol-4-reductase
VTGAPAARPVLVTGGSGFLGEGIVRRLVADGRRVRALARSAASADALAALGAEPVRGDVLDAASLEAACAGCGSLFHVAGANAFCLPDPRRLYEVNVTGTANVIRAAARAGVGRVVYTSSAAAIGEPAGVVAREDTPHRGSYLSHYERSKHQAELRALDLAGAEGLDLVCVNPASVQGPGRTRGTARLIIDYVNGRLRAVVESRVSFVDVRDCTEGHVLAERRGRPGERYLLSGAAVTLREAVETVAQVAGVRRPYRPLPAPLALAAGAGVELAFRVRGRRAPLCREMVRTVLHGHAYDGSRATRELGLVYTPFAETVRRTLTWYVEHGYVRVPLPGLGADAPSGEG